jgi:hypothetical protein
MNPDQFNAHTANLESLIAQADSHCDKLQRTAESDNATKADWTAYGKWCDYRAALVAAHELIGAR